MRYKTQGCWVCLVLLPQLRSLWLTQWFHLCIFLQTQAEGRPFGWTLKRANRIDLQVLHSNAPFFPVSSPDLHYTYAFSPSKVAQDLLKSRAEVLTWKQSLDWGSVSISTFPAIKIKENPETVYTQGVGRKMPSLNLCKKWTINTLLHKDMWRQD